MGASTVGDSGLVCALRDFAGAEDEGLVYNAWCEQVRRVKPFSEMDPAAFRSHKKRVIESLVSRCGVKLACHMEYPDQVFGYIVSENQSGDPVLHMVYVKGPFRNAGLGSWLMESAFPEFRKREVFFTHPTRASRHFEDKWKLVYAPHRVL